MAARLSSVDDYKALIDQYDTWLFDCDGVLWEGTRVIKGATEFLAYLRKLGECLGSLAGPRRSLITQIRQGKAVIFVTNNATQSRQMYKAKFDKLGVEAHVVSAQISFTRLVKFMRGAQDEIVGSAYAAAVYISSVMKLPKDKKVYVVGMTGIEEELREEGISFLGGTVRPPASPCPRLVR